MKRMWCCFQFTLALHRLNGDAFVVTDMRIPFVPKTTAVTVVFSCPVSVPAYPVIPSPSSFGNLFSSAE